MGYLHDQELRCSLFFQAPLQLSFAYAIERFWNHKNGKDAWESLLDFKDFLISGAIAVLATRYANRAVGRYFDKKLAKEEIRLRKLGHPKEEFERLKKQVKGDLEANKSSVGKLVDIFVWVIAVPPFLAWYREWERKKDLEKAQQNQLQVNNFSINPNNQISNTLTFNSARDGHEITFRKLLRNTFPPLGNFWTDAKARMNAIRAYDPFALPFFAIWEMFWIQKNIQHKDDHTAKEATKGYTITQLGFICTHIINLFISAFLELKLVQSVSRGKLRFSNKALQHILTAQDGELAHFKNILNTSFHTTNSVLLFPILMQPIRYYLDKYLQHDKEQNSKSHFNSLSLTAQSKTAQPSQSLLSDSKNDT